jgi:perosamine synthetase
MTEINIAKPLLGEEEIKEVARVIRSGMIASGPETKLFEQEFAEFVGCAHACAVNNGTSALSLALSASGVGPGDEVITSPFTFVATANSILSCGATPVFADVEVQTYNISPESVRAKITDKTKAVIPVHLYGLPCEMGELMSISSQHGLITIGDAAQAHGAGIGNRKIGSIADIECFSFYPTKNMTTGEGGMVTTNDPELHRLMNSIRNHGRPDSSLGVYEHSRFGLNLRLTDIGSAIGRVQLKKLPEFNRIREKNAEILNEKLSGLSGITTPTVPPGMTHAWHQYTIRVGDRESLSGFLRSRGIGSGSYYPRLIQDYPHLKRFSSDCPNAEEMVSQVISLPIHAGLSEGDIHRVGEAVVNWHESL